MWPGEVQGGYSTQWALNPSAYQHLPNEQVDWATLAQQWIKMKETFPVDQVPPAPPPPMIKNDIEAGEAPMDMSKDDIIPITPAAVSTSQDGSNWSGWNSWQPWDWNWGGPHVGSGAAPMPPEKAPAVPPYTYPSTNVPPYPAPEPPPFDYSRGAAVTTNNSFEQQEYWSGGNQAPFVRNKNSDWREDQRAATTSQRPTVKVEEAEPDTTTLFDAAKRKQLPAWIREGLEKMEREKQKKIERERQLKEREEEMKRRKKEEEESLASGIPLKSKFDTDSEESEKEVVEEMPVKSRKSRFDVKNTVPTEPSVDKSSPPPIIPVKRKSRDEIMQDIMQQVRYILTSILMKVTNEEMHKIAEEVHADFRTKGLGIYDSDSEESLAESDSGPGVKQNGVDSDEELRERIHRKKQEFARIERDIEHEVEIQEEREREREQRAQEIEEEPHEENVDKGQVEPKLLSPGDRQEEKIEESKTIIELNAEENHTECYTPERPYKKVIDSSDEQSEDIDQQSSSKSTSSSSSSSSSRYRKSRKSIKRRKEKKSSKRKHKRSLSRGSDRRKSSHRKSSHRYEERYREKSRSRSRSRSRGQYDNYRRKRRHSSESSHHRSKHHSYSRSPEHSRGKKSSYRSRD